METKRRVAIYLDSRKPIAKIQLNHAYSKKLEQIISRTGEKKSTAARNLLGAAFGITEISELKERIFYAVASFEFSKQTINKKTTGAGSKISHICKMALRKAIDQHPVCA